MKYVFNEMELEEKKNLEETIARTRQSEEKAEATGDYDLMRAIDNDLYLSERRLANLEKEFIVKDILSRFFGGWDVIYDIKPDSYYATFERVSCDDDEIRCKIAFWGDYATIDVIINNGSPDGYMIDYSGVLSSLSLFSEAMKKIDNEYNFRFSTLDIF